MKALSPAMAAHVQLSHATIGCFALLELDGAPLRVCDVDHAVRWQGETWFGAGELAGVSTIKESASGEAPRFTLTLSGLPADRRALVLSTPTYGRKVTLWLAGFDAQTYQVVADPVVELAGIMDAATIGTAYDDIERRTSMTIAVPVTTREARWPAAAAAGGRRTDSDQQARHPGDRFFLHVAKTAMAAPLVWPAASWFRR